jgi:hypothetical protein
MRCTENFTFNVCVLINRELLYIYYTYIFLNVDIKIKKNYIFIDNFIPFFQRRLALQLVLQTAWYQAETARSGGRNHIKLNEI